jgi:hypothetical protein
MSDITPIPAELPPADSAPVEQAAQPPSPNGSTPEEHNPMLDVHPAHHAANSWKEFFVHIATIVLGLLIAVGIEQTVEYFHHRREIAEFHGQIREALEINLRVEPSVDQRLRAYRNYLQELEAAVKARRAGHPLSTEPAANDSRMKKFLTTPSLAPYEAAKQDGTVALLSSDEIRLYNRMALQRDFFMGGITDWFHDSRALEAFEERFTDSKSNLEIGTIVTAPDLSKLSPADLLEYEKLIAALIKTTDLIGTRLRLFDTMCRAVLDGVQNEDQLLATYLSQDPDLELSEPSPAGKP